MRSSLEIYAEKLLDRLCREHPMGYVPKLTWKRLRVTAGIAYFRRSEIVLSSLVLIDEERLQSTLTHEYAHLLAFKRHGMKGAGHGQPWRQAMVDLGLEPIVHHDYEVQRNATRQKVVYRCIKCGTKLDRARRFPKRRRYVHARCGGALRLEGIERTGAA
jgi:predicted SprT family Zn-dependent metalloprotease